MKKKFLLFFVIVLISGCIDYYQEFEFNKDGEGKFFIHYWMKRKNTFYDSTKSRRVNDSLFISKFYQFNPDTLKKLYVSEHLSEFSANTFSDSVDNTIHTQIMFKFKDVNKLSEVPPLSVFRISYKDGAEGQKVFREFVPPLNALFTIPDSTLTFKVVVYLPGIVITHNANELYKNRVTWVFKHSEIGTGKYLVATIKPFKLKETPKWLYYLSGSVLLIVIYFLLRKGK
ncbi:MAG TPA: hypothetical protein PK887_01860 [Ignavibacteriales bacterium]|jgi:hypothetical protein|nr:hypothetical protein [Ignavibacteriales bacterium]